MTSLSVKEEEIENSTKKDMQNYNPLQKQWQHFIRLTPIRLNFVLL